MSQKPDKPKSSNPYNTISASKRRAQRQAKIAQQSAARRSLSMTGLDPIEQERLRLDERERSARRAQKAAEAKQQDAELTTQLLANPTKFVSEDELKAEYTYVLKDLGSMGILAAGLVVVLFLLAQFLPR
jgi:DNA-binding response OmpR family regulator